MHSQFTRSVDAKPHLPRCASLNARTAHLDRGGADRVHDGRGDHRRHPVRFDGAGRRRLAHGNPCGGAGDRRACLSVCPAPCAGPALLARHRKIRRTCRLLQRHHPRNDRAWGRLRIGRCGSSIPSPFISARPFRSPRSALPSISRVRGCCATSTITVMIMHQITTTRDDHADHKHGAHHHDINLRAAYVHVLADALISILAIAGLSAAWAFGWVFMDPLVGLIGAAVIASWSFSLLRAAGRVLLDTVPDPELAQRIRTRMELRRRPPVRSACLAIGSRPFRRDGVDCLRGAAGSGGLQGEARRSRRPVACHRRSPCLPALRLSVALATALVLHKPLFVPAVIAQDRPAAFVDAAAVVPGLIADMRYAGVA